MDSEKRERAKKAMAEKKEKISRKLRENVKHSIIVMSGKGGVGKSTVAANIATGLKMRGYEVGLMDCDMHGPSIPKIVGVREKKATTDGEAMNPIETDFGLEVISIDPLLPDDDSPVIWRGPLKMKTLQQFLGDVNWGRLDYLVFDLPPGTGDEPLSIAQLIPDPDGAVIVTTPQEVALQTIRRSVNFAEKVELPVLGIVENMSGFVCPNCGSEIDIFRSGGGKDLSEELGIPFLGKVPIHSEIVESGEEGKPIVLDKRSKPAKAFEDVISAIENILEEKSGSESK